MEKKELETLVKKGKSTRNISKALGVSQTNVRYWLNKFDLKTSSSFFREKYECLSCGETNEEKMMSKGRGRKSKSLCRSCHNTNTIKRGQDNKLKAVEYKGEKCTECGYNKCTAALEFHHLDPTEKDPNFTSMRTWGWERIRAEIDKCELFCSNCHREIHFGLIV